MKFHIVVNRASGLSRGEADKVDPTGLEGLFAGHGHAARCVVVGPDGLDAGLDAAMESGADVVVVGGGDGTVRAGASRLAGSGKAMAVLPLGTMNYFARLCGLPMNVEDAVAALVKGMIRPVDMLEVNGRSFVSHSTIGIHPLFVRQRLFLQRKRGWAKAPAMAWALARSLAAFPIMRLTLEVEGRREILRTPYLLAGNTAMTLNPLTLDMPEERLDSGRMALFVSRRHHSLGLVLAVLRSLLGRVDLEADFRLLRPAAFRLDFARARHVSLDGELFKLEPPLDYRVHPRALAVLMPAREGRGGEQFAGRSS